MNLLEQIKNDALEARKARNKVHADVLTTLYAEAAMIGKNKQRETTDEEVIKLVKKFIFNNEETMPHVTDSDTALTLMEENTALAKYLPPPVAQLADDELLTIIKGQIVDGMSNIGQLMGHLKKTYPGAFDGAKASVLIKQALA